MNTNTNTTPTVNAAGFLVSGHTPMDLALVQAAFGGKKPASQRLAEVIANAHEDVIAFQDLVARAEVPRTSINLTMKVKIVQQALQDAGFVIGYRQDGATIRAYLVRGEAAAAGSEV